MGRILPRGRAPRFWAFVFCAAIGSGAGRAAAEATAKIAISPTMVFRDKALPDYGNYGAYFDEQSLAGDPLNGRGGKPATNWNSQNWKDENYPLGPYVDLGREYVITHAAVFDTFNTGAMELQVGAPGAWVAKAKFRTDGWQSWRVVPIDARSRYFRVSRDPFAGINEVVLYGYPVSGPAPSPTPSPSATPKPTPTATPSPSPSPSPTPVPSGRGTTTLRPHGTPSARYGYVEYLPPGYAQGANFPLVLFLHGMGEQGNGKSDLARVRTTGPNKQIDVYGKDFPFVMISPQTSGFWSDWEAANWINPFLTELLALYKVDPKRVYVTGLSMGGAGTWAVLKNLPERIAAAIPICGADYSANAAQAGTLVNGPVAVWAAHAVDDRSNSISSSDGWMTQIGYALGADRAARDDWTGLDTSTGNLPIGAKRWAWTPGQTTRDAGGAETQRPYLFTVYRTGGHFIWDRMYGDPKVFEWLLRQRKR